MVNKNDMTNLKNVFKIDYVSLEILMNSLKKPNTLTDLRFFEAKIEDDIIYASYYGHEVGGSYVYDYQVAPKYVEDLEYTTNRKVEWLGRKCGGMGYDIYQFKIYIKWVLNDSPYIPKGKIFRVANTYLGNKSCGDNTWAFLYMLHTAIMNNVIPENISIKIMKDDENFDVMYFENKPIAVILEYEPETYHTFRGHNTSTGRTRYHAIYDLLIDESLFIKTFFKINKDIINTYLKHECFLYLLV
jgi:hypothetical protein